MSIVCEEVFDDSHPSIDEIRDYATKIGIDPEAEPQLLSLAAEGLMKALPVGWKPCYDDQRKSYYYYNNITGKSQWEHPLDDVYRDLVRKVRSESQSLSIGEDTTRDDVPSFEEVPRRRLEPLKLPKNDEDKSFVKHPRILEKAAPELKISGGGAMFLKTNTKSKDAKSETLEPPPRSILRTLEVSKSMDFDRVSQEDDDRKSVRFNLDTNTDIAFTFSEKSSSSDEEVEVKPKSRFTVSPVKDFAFEVEKKLIKPNPSDFIKPKLTINSDSDDDESIVKKIEDQADRKYEKLKQDIWEEKNDELLKFKDDLQSSQKEEFERILIGAKKEHEDRIKAELDSIRIEMEVRHSGTIKQEKEMFESRLDGMKEELEESFKIKEEELKMSFESKRDEIEKYYEDKLVEIEKELAERMEKNRDELIFTHNSNVEQLKQNHSIIIEDLKRGFKLEEDTLRREHKAVIAEIKAKIANEADRKDEKWEKLKSEKRLLDEKYRCLKEKYIRLKTEVKMSIEKRNKRKEQSATTTTGSETERSHKEKTPLNSPSRKPPPKPKPRPLLIDLDTSVSDKSELKLPNKDYDSSDTSNPGRSRKKIFSRLKSSSTSRMNNKKAVRVQRSCSPVENLRRQLQKLEDLEDQFPNAQSETYHLRYPFSDEKKIEQGSSELEFFRHRIHLERDSIKRAKESLRTQKSMFQQRQNELKLKHGTMARHTYQQLCHEERELTDMEVSLHRTRSLLGEKVIRLRHLEQSLQRATVTNDRIEEATLSDISSHSASSGISSTEFVTADHLKGVIQGEHLQESSEIIQSLETLNLEIREIWDVLRKQAGVAATPALMYPPDLGWPLLGGTAAPPSIPTLADRLHNYRQQVALANAQSTVVTHANQGATTTLVERTRNLRHWLRQAGIEGAVDGGGTPQATL